MGSLLPNEAEVLAKYPLPPLASLDLKKKVRPCILWSDPTTTWWRYPGKPYSIPLIPSGKCQPGQVLASKTQLTDDIVLWTTYVVLPNGALVLTPGIGIYSDPPEERLKYGLTQAMKQLKKTWTSNVKAGPDYTDRLHVLAVYAHDYRQYEKWKNDLSK